MLLSLAGVQVICKTYSTNSLQYISSSCTILWSKTFKDTLVMDMQNAGMDDSEGDTQARRIYHIKNCGMVHIDSFNAHRSIRIQDW